MSKQTAVEWYRRQIMAVFTGESETQHMTEPEIYALSIKMEREHIEEAYGVGHNDGCSYMIDGKTEFKNAEQYYEQTYGKEAGHEA